MKKMYTGKLKHNIILVSSFIVSVSVIYSIESYLDARTELMDEAFRNRVEVRETTYLAFVKNGFTLNDVH